MDEREGFLLAATGIHQFKQFHFIKNFSSKNIYQEAEFKITNKFKTIWKAENGWNNERINVVWDTMESTPKKNTICHWFAMRRI